MARRFERIPHSDCNLAEVECIALVDFADILGCILHCSLADLDCSLRCMAAAGLHCSNLEKPLSINYADLPGRCCSEMIS